MKKKEIEISYVVHKMDTTIRVQYVIEEEQNIQTINCNILTDVPSERYMLQLRHFELRSMRMDDGQYAPLFTDNEYIRNKNAIHFMKKAYEAIMKKEGYNIEVIESNL